MLNWDLERAFSPRSVWREAQRLQDEMNSLLARGAGSAAFPAVNLWRAGENAILTSELPGVEPQNIDMSIVGDVLTIRVKHAADQDVANATFHRRERPRGEYTRAIQLPFRVEADEVTADLKNGVLAITLPQANTDRPRKIHVKTA